MKTYTAFTLEIDDIELAVGEILTQLNLEQNLQKHAIGLLTCYSEFIDGGVVAALCEKLPFNVVGATTLGNCMPGGMGPLMLGLTVLTDDEIEFAAVVTDSITDGVDAPIAAAYEKACSLVSSEPAMMLAFAPLIFSIAGDQIVSALNDVSNGLPVFGTLAVDHTNDYRSAQTIFNGEASRESMALVLIAGNAQPKFFIASISDDKLLKQKAIITASQGNLLQCVNDISVLEYMHTIGLAKDGRIEGINSIPFVVDYNDGTKPVARAIFALTPEGYAVCGGEMPVNATLGVGSINHNEVVDTARDMTKRVLETGMRDGLLLFSCVARSLALGLDSQDEMEAVSCCAQGSIPYSMSYSGGEICPVYDEQGMLKNRFHNETIVACLF